MKTTDTKNDSDSYGSLKASKDLAEEQKRVKDQSLFVGFVSFEEK